MNYEQTCDDLIVMLSVFPTREFSSQHKFYLCDSKTL